jgi:hypothetical protein
VEDGLSLAILHSSVAVFQSDHDLREDPPNDFLSEIGSVVSVRAKVGGAEATARPYLSRLHLRMIFPRSPPAQCSITIYSLRETQRERQRQTETEREVRRLIGRERRPGGSFINNTIIVTDDEGIAQFPEDVDLKALISSKKSESSLPPLQQVAASLVHSWFHNSTLSTPRSVFTERRGQSGGLDADLVINSSSDLADLSEGTGSDDLEFLVGFHVEAREGKSPRHSNGHEPFHRCGEVSVWLGVAMVNEQHRATDSSGEIVKERFFNFLKGYHEAHPSSSG